MMAPSRSNTGVLLLAVSGLSLALAWVLASPSGPRPRTGSCVPAESIGRGVTSPAGPRRRWAQGSDDTEAA